MTRPHDHESILDSVSYRRKIEIQRGGVRNFVKRIHPLVSGTRQTRRPKAFLIFEKIAAEGVRAPARRREAAGFV
jgi:hypothetical protein